MAKEPDSSAAPFRTSIGGQALIEGMPHARAEETGYSCEI